jgi:hypothetical protein
MKTFTLALLVLLTASLALSQTTETRAWNRTITAAWDSAYVLTPIVGSVIDISNTSTTDTLIYFFGRNKADSTTSAMFRLYPGYSKRFTITVPGSRFKACFRKSSGSDIVSNLEQLP